MQRSSSKRKSFVVNPLTGRQIEIGKDTYQKLMADPRHRAILAKAKPEAKAPRKSPTPQGCSDQRKYIHSHIPENLFCGPSGGACRFTYPVDTPGRARAALAYSRFAPNPKGIRDCVHTIAAKKGWLAEDGVRLRVPRR